MQKINFVDTEVIKAPYVKVNGNEYEVQSEYQGGTDLNAETFNQMQDNIDEGKQDTLESGVNIKTLNNQSILGSGNLVINVSSDGWINLPSGTIFDYFSWDNSTKIGVATTRDDFTDTLSVGMKLKFLNGGTTKYGIIIAIASSSVTLYFGNSNILENTALEFIQYSMVDSPYGCPSDIKKIDELYLTTEIPIGSYRGKTLYRKVVPKTGLTTGFNNVTHGIANFDKAINIYGNIYISNRYQPIPRVVPDGITTFGIGIGDVSSTSFAIIIGTSYTSIGEANVIFEYTKTTD